jgi:peptidoglycan/LPS O-acetylase OafA/YrhL
VGALLGTIRFLFALAVVMVHAGKIPFYSGINSLLAVQGFYVISGFLIARAWDIKYAGLRNGVRSFYGNRAARIF